MPNIFSFFLSLKKPHTALKENTKYFQYTVKNSPGLPENNIETCTTWEKSVLCIASPCEEMINE